MHFASRSENSRVFALCRNIFSRAEAVHNYIYFVFEGFDTSLESRRGNCGCLARAGTATADV